MNRRSFLELLAAVGVLAGAPTWLRDPQTVHALAPSIALPDDDDVSEWLNSTDLAVQGRTASIFEVAMFNATANVARMQLARFVEDGGHTLIDLVTGPGGIVRWIPPLGEGIYGPVRIIVPEGVDAQVFGTNQFGQKVMASRSGIVLLQPPTLTRHQQQRMAWHRRLATTS